MDVYIIVASWGEYDDHTTMNLFACRTRDEAALLVEALNNKEEGYWEKVFRKFQTDGGYIPHDIYFYFDKIEIISI